MMAKGPNNPFRCVRPACANKQAGQLGFTNERGLTMHTARVHEGMGPGNRPVTHPTHREEQCPYCGRRYRYIKSHISRSHPGMKGKEIAVPRAVPSTDIDLVSVVEQLVRRPMSDDERDWIVGQLSNFVRDEAGGEGQVETVVEEAVVEVKAQPVVIPMSTVHTMRVLPFVVMMDEDGGIWHCERVVEP